MPNALCFHNVEDHESVSIASLIRVFPFSKLTLTYITESRDPSVTISQNGPLSPCA